MEVNGNGIIKKLKNILGLIIALGIVGTSIWGYVENKVGEEIKASENKITTEINKDISKLDRKITLMLQRDWLKDRIRSLEKLLGEECPNKDILKKEYTEAQKGIAHIDKKLKHM